MIIILDLFLVVRVLIYGTPKHIPTPETEKVDCLCPYAFQKYEFEKYLELISKRFPWITFP